MRTVTLDASVALAWLLDEARPTWVDDLLEDVGRGMLRLSVPSLFWLEVGSTLARDHDLSDDQAMEGLMRLEGLAIETIEIDTPLRLRSLLLARQTGLTMYDATYLGLAVTTGTGLATLDGRLAAAGSAHGLPSQQRGHQASEEGEPYSSPLIADTASLAALGTVLADLRRRYSAA